MGPPKEMEDIKTALESKGFSTGMKVNDNGGCSGENVEIILVAFIMDHKFATISLKYFEEMKHYAVSKKEIVRNVKVHEIPKTIDAGRKFFERKLATLIQCLPETFWPQVV